MNLGASTHCPTPDIESRTGLTYDYRVGAQEVSASAAVRAWGLDPQLDPPVRRGRAVAAVVVVLAHLTRTGPDISRRRTLRPAGLREHRHARASERRAA
jgi:hypothetical protein